MKNSTQLPTDHYIFINESPIQLVDEVKKSDILLISLILVVGTPIISIAFILSNHL
jgi:hypothetical protein